MTAQLRAPGWYRAGVFIVLGVLFSAALVTAVRAAYGAQHAVRRLGRLGRRRGRTRC